MELDGISKFITKSTAGISSPRDATSVAIRIDLSPALNLFRAASLYCYDNYPLILTALKFKFLNIKASFKDWLHVVVNIIVFYPENSVSRNTKYVSLCFAGINI